MDINIEKEVQFLTLIDKRLEGNYFLPSYLIKDLKNIKEIKILTEDNIYGLFCHLHETTVCHEAAENCGYYYTELVNLIRENKMPALEAVNFITEIEREDNYMISIIFKYFNYTYRSDFLTIDLEIINEEV